jgi:hypothetical protein
LSAVRIRLFLGMTAILVVVAGLTAFVATRAEDLGDGGSPVVGGTVDPGTGDTTTTTGSGGPATVPAAGSVKVEGTITDLHLEQAQLDPETYPTPLTVTSDRGFGNGGEINGVTVEGKPASIVWDGGTPFVLASGGGLVLDPVNVDLSPVGIRLALSYSVQGFAPGAYQLNTNVAVGTSGVAGARDSVAFAATADSTFEPKGDAALFLDGTKPRHLTGPGKVHLVGTLTVTDPTGATRDATGIDLDDGPYDLTFTAKPGGGWLVSGTLQGATKVT